LNYSHGWPSQQKTPPAEAYEVKQQQKYRLGLTGTGEGNFHLLLVQKVRLEHLEEDIIDLWHYVYALRLRLKDG
jgi:hypothetical protein